MQDSLIGYLLGALDDAESARVEATLKHDPELKRQLQRAALSLRVLRGDAGDFEPPAGLAESTSSFVHRRALAQLQAAHSASPPSWTMVDMAIAATIFLAACLLFFPAVSNSRYHARIAGCQNNLREIGRALIEYSSLNAQGLFPQVPEAGNFAVAGMYAPTLREAQLVLEDSRFLCPDSEREAMRDFRVPTTMEVRVARGQELAMLQARMGGLYGYALGFQKDGHLYGIRNQSRTHFALMSDTPDDRYLCGGAARPVDRHRNLLFESGHVRQVPPSCQCWCGDELYVNDNGKISAGVHESDVVIGSSGTSPIVNVSY